MTIILQPTLGERYHRRKDFFKTNNASSTFYLRLYGDRHVVKDHSNNEREKHPFRHFTNYPLWEVLQWLHWGKLIYRAVASRAEALTQSSVLKLRAKRYT